MRALVLEQSLYRRQKAAIADALGKRPKRHLVYERRYLRHLPRAGEPISLREVDRRIRQADVIFVGDYASFAPAQRAFADRARRSAMGRRPTVIALQAVDESLQPDLARFVCGKLTPEALRRRLGQAGMDGDVFWSHLEPILTLAKEHELEILPLDAGGASLDAWDRAAAERIARRVSEHDHPRIFVLAGQYHVAACHLPAALHQRVEAKTLTLFQNAEPHYWAAAREGVRGAAALAFGEDELCLFSGSPVLCQQSFLELIESDEGDPRIEGPISPTLRRIADRYGATLGLKVARPFAALNVASAENLDALVAVTTGGAFSRAEQQRIHRHVLSRESGYFPKARLLYLANRSLTHAAEEVAHWLRHVLVGDALLRPRSPAQAFHARALEEALAFFATRWILPSRPHRPVEEFLLALEGRGAERQEAAFVLAHLSAAKNGGTLEALIPHRAPELFDRVAHGLGYLLGDGLARAHRRGRIDEGDVRRLFRDPFDDASGAFNALARDLLR